MNSEMPRPDRPRHLWYFVAIGLVAGVAVMAVAIVPPALVWVPVLVAALLVWLVDFFTRRFSTAPLAPPLRKEALIFVIAVGVVLVGSLTVAWMVAREDGVWLAGVLAVIVFLFTSTGAWVPERSPAPVS